MTVDLVSLGTWVYVQSGHPRRSTYSHSILWKQRFDPLDEP